MINSSIITAMLSELLFIVMFPIMLMFILKIRTKTSIVPLFIGALTFFVSVMVFENMLHATLFHEGSALAVLSEKSVIFYVVYVIITTAVFEETGRFAFAKLFEKKYNNRLDAVTMGIGFGGLEAFITVGLSVFLNATYASVVNEMGFDEFILTMEVADRPAVTELIESISNLTVFDCFLNSLDSVANIVMHISLSIFVFYAVQKRRYVYYLIAMIIRLLYSAPMAMVQCEIIGSERTAKGICLVFSALLALFAYKIYKGYNSELDPLFGQKNVKKTD